MIYRREKKGVTGEDNHYLANFQNAGGVKKKRGRGVSITNPVRRGEGVKASLFYQSSKGREKGGGKTVPHRWSAPERRNSKSFVEISSKKGEGGLASRGGAEKKREKNVKKNGAHRGEDFEPGRGGERKRKGKEKENLIF